MIIPVILCGGMGSRLWPLSRESMPKQFLKLVDDNYSLLQQTILRIEHLLKEQNNLYVIANQNYRFKIAEQLAEINIDKSKIILEPESKNTAIAVATAALSALNEYNDNDILLILSSDHIIKNNTSFIQAIEQAKILAENEYIVTFGTKPYYPETGYGYISLGDKLLNGFKIKEFKEKPNKETAQKYIENNYLWNSGMFMFKISTILDEFKEYAPDILINAQKALETSHKDFDWLRLNKEEFKNARNISLDYAIIEKSQKTAIITLDAGWSDVGSFESLYNCRNKDNNDNVINGDVITHNTNNCLVISDDKLIVTNHVKNLAIIQTKDSILISDLAKSQEIKEIVTNLKQENRSEAVESNVEYRPWGNYQVIHDNRGFKVKHIIVKPKQKLSLQMHNFRSEHWVIVKGKAKITKAEDEFILLKDQSIYIPSGKLHRIENISDENLEFIEVQTGIYLGEDDIIRVEDSYGRIDDDTNNIETSQLILEKT